MGKKSCKRKGKNKKKWGKMPKDKVGRGWVKSHCGKAALKKFGKKKGAPRVGIAWIKKHCSRNKKAAIAYFEKKRCAKKKKKRCGGCGCAACSRLGGCRCLTTVDGQVCSWPMTFF